MTVTIKLGQLAEFLGATLRGDPEKQITGLATLQEAGPAQLSFLANPQYRKYLAGSQAAALLLKEADAEGFAGLQDGVDYHWWDLAKAAGLSTLLSVGAELAVDNDDRLIQAIRNGGQDTLNDAGQQIVRRQLNVPPTLTVRPGFPVRVIVTRDLVLEPYGG